MEGLHIQKIIIRNFQRIEHFEADAQGKNLFLIAKNNGGKSSFLNAVRAVLGDVKALGTMPLHKDHEEGYVQAFTGADGNEYVLNLKLEKGKAPKLTIKAPDGVTISKKSLITDLLGEPDDFDIWEFIKWGESESGRKKQLELVKSFLSVQEQDVLKTIEKQVQDNYDTRTEVNREITRLNGVIEKFELTHDQITLYSQQKDIDEVQTRYSRAVKHNTAIESVKERMRDRELEIANAVSAAKAVEVRIENLKRELVAAEAELATANTQTLILRDTQVAAEAWLANIHAIDTTLLEVEVKSVSEHNTQHGKVVAHRVNQETIKKLKEQSESLTTMINAGREEIATTLREIGLPLDGLSFEGDHLQYNGMPLEEAVMSTSDIMMVAVQLKIAKNPHARVLCIEDGQSLDEDKLKILLELSNKYGFQLFIEEVKRGQKELIYEFINPDTI